MLFSGRLLLPSQSYHDLWLEYALVVVITPIAVAGALLLEWRGMARFAGGVKIMLSGLCLLVTVRFLLVGRSPLLLLLAAVQLGLVAGLRARPLRGGGWRAILSRESLAALPIAGFVSLAAWAAATQLIWWTPWDALIRGHLPALVALSVALVLTVLTLHARPPPEAPGRRWPSRLPSRLLTVAGIALLLVMAFRDDGLFVYVAFHHWGYYTGPAELVRQGHWLLWDVPAQYGFLSTATIALLPTGTVWQSLFVLNGVLTAICAVVVFLTVRSLGSGIPNVLLALALAMASEFLRYFPVPAGFLGPVVFPSTGGLRFVWVILLMALLLRLTLTGGRGRLAWYGAGCALWLVGVLWSFESAVYCSAIWLPASALLAVQRARQEAGVGSPGRRLRLAAAWACIPPLTLLTAILLLSGYYLIGLGHPPDWRNFTEFVSSFQAGYQAAGMDLGGVVWVLLVIFCAITAASYQILRSAPATSPAVWGAWAGMAVTASYFMGRTHPSIVQVLSPVFVMSVAMILHLVRSRELGGRRLFLFRIAVTPVITMLLLGGFGQTAELGDYFSGIARERAHVKDLLPQVDPAAQSLLSQAHVGSSDPITFVECYPVPARMPRWIAEDGTLVSDVRSWLPLDPYGEILPLSAERLEVYLQRFAGASSGGGWVMQCKGTLAPLTGVLDWIGRNYRTDQVLENAGWRLTRYTPRHPADREAP